MTLGKLADINQEILNTGRDARMLDKDGLVQPLLLGWICAGVWNVQVLRKDRNTVFHSG